MKIEIISGDEYAKVFQKPMHVYNTIHFSNVVKTKCDSYVCLFMQKSKTKIGMIAGFKGDTLYSPFSAPFGGFSFNNYNIKLLNIEASIKLVEKYVSQNGLKKIVYVLPPYFYNKNILPKQSFILAKLNYSVRNDINYHFNTSDIVIYKNGGTDRSNRNNLRKAIKSGLTFEKVADDTNKYIAYSIIKINKEEKNRPLHLSFEDLKATSEVIEIDYFIVYLENQAIASAIVYHVAEDIVQIVYWGNIPENAVYRPMNFMAYNLFSYYSEQNIKIVDLGISTEKGTPNYGLCDFKENIGCTPSLKQTFTKLVD